MYVVEAKLTVQLFTNRGLNLGKKKTKKRIPRALTFTQSSDAHCSFV